MHTWSNEHKGNTAAEKWVELQKYAYSDIPVWNELNDNH